MGAGFDTLALRLTAAGRRDVRVLEIDYASVLAAKAKLLANSSAPPLSPENYVATSADLSDVSATEKALIDAGVDKTLPTLILSEVCFLNMFGCFFLKLIYILIFNFHLNILNVENSVV